MTKFPSLVAGCMLTLLAAVALLPRSAAADAALQGTIPDGEPLAVSIAIGAPDTPVYLNFDVAQTLGYFEAEGLDVDLQYFQGGTDAAAALTRGAVDFSGNSMDHVLEAQIAGEELRMLMNFLDYPCIDLIVPRELATTIQSPADLDDRAVGITRLGSATHVLAVYLVTNAGLDAAAVDFVEVGASTMPAALEDGTIDAAVGVPPYTTALIESGEAVSLVDLCQPAQARAYIGGSLPFTGLLTRADVLAEQPEAVTAVVNALVKAQIFITTHSAAETAAVLADDMETADVITLVSGIEATLPSFDAEGGMIDEEGLQRFLQLHETFGTIEDAATVDVAALYANQAVVAAVNAQRVVNTASAITEMLWSENVYLTIFPEEASLASDGIPHHTVLSRYGGQGLVDRSERFFATIEEYPLEVTVPLTPTLAVEPIKTGVNTIGLMISGAPLFNPYEADQVYVALDDQFFIEGVPFVDGCNGHPTPDTGYHDHGGGVYHYHGRPGCITNIVDVPGEHSKAIGLALDGYPIYGAQDERGAAPASLNRCSGHFGPTPEFPDGIFHYHLIDVSPYSLLCFSGEVENYNPLPPVPLEAPDSD